MRRRRRLLSSVAIVAALAASLSVTHSQQVVRRPITASASLTTPEVEFDALNLSGADGSTISTWSDSSGNGRDAAIGLDPTTVETNELNGHQISRWNGGDGVWSGKCPEQCIHRDRGAQMY